MKTPREILFGRHQTAEPKLDALRRDIVENLSTRESDREQRATSFIAACLDMFRLPRWAWSGLGAAWIVIIALNIAARETTPAAATVAVMAKRSPDTLQALREQKQLFAELVGLRSENATAEPARFVPRPRSERAETTACV